MVSGHLQIKKGYYYAVLSYYDNRGKQHMKYVATGLPEKGNKRRAETVLVKITTYGSYEQMTKQTIEPYFRKLHLSLAQIEAWHIQQFYSGKLKTVSVNS